jgi:predicted deacylase
VSQWTKTRVALKGGTGFERWRLDSGVAGDRVVVFGGTHGDETEGVIAANRLAGAGLALKKGVLEIVPIVHESAFYADRRVSALDGGDLARSFPGRPDGTPTEILADALHRQVLAGADLLIDLHTAGQSLDIPFIAGYIDDGRDRRGLSAKAAQAFGADFIWRHPERPPGRTISGMDAAIYTEYPAPGPTDLRCVESYVAGVKRVLSALGMIDPSAAPAPARPSTKLVSGGNVDSDMQTAGAAGLFLSRVRYGEQVKQGQVLGQIVDPRGTVLEDIRSPYDGWIVVMMRRPHVKPGDRLVAIAVADE